MGHPRIVWATRPSGAFVVLASVEVLVHHYMGVVKKSYAEIKGKIAAGEYDKNDSSKDDDEGPPWPRPISFGGDDASDG